MSAYLCSPSRISAIVTARAHLRANGKLTSVDWREPAFRADLDRVFAVLVAENNASVAYRYNEAPADVSGYAFAPVAFPAMHAYRIAESAASVQARKIVARILHACRSYVYQASEHPAWPDSEACKIIAEIVETCAHALARGVDADWPSADDDHYFTAEVA